MYEHIKSFTALMERKGYDGTFVSSYGFFGKLKENLIQHVFQSFVEKKSVGPLNLSTYSKWKDDNSPYVRCDFHADYSNAAGFQVLNMEINYGNGYGIFRNKELHFRNNGEIPEREQANQMVLNRKKSLRL